MPKGLEFLGASVSLVGAALAIVPVVFVSIASSRRKQMMFPGSDSWDHLPSLVTWQARARAEVKQVDAYYDVI